MSRNREKVTVPMLHRMVALERAGLSRRAIAAVIELDYGVRLCEGTVRYRLKTQAPELERRHGLGLGMTRPAGPGLGIQAAA